MAEKVIFGMPADPEMFLAALSVVQSYMHEMQLQIDNAYKEIAKSEKQNQYFYEQGKQPLGKYEMFKDQCRVARQMQEDRKTELHIHIPNPEMDIFKPTFGEGTIFETDYKPRRGEYDLAHQFDAARAYAIGSITQRHATQAFSLLIGADALSMPDLRKVQFDPEYNWARDILLVYDDKSLGWVTDFMEMLRTQWPDKAFTPVVNPSVEDIATSKMIIGPQSFATYVGCSFRKKVIELVPQTRYKRWLSKFDNPNYRMLYSDTPTADQVWKIAEALWAVQDIQTLDTGLELPTQMAQRISAVGLAVGLSRGRVAL